MGDNKMRQRPPEFVRRKNHQVELFREFVIVNSRCHTVFIFIFKNIFSRNRVSPGVHGAPGHISEKNVP